MADSLMEQLRDAVHGGPGSKQIARCDECKREYPNVEPDADFDCRSDDCDGRVKSDLRRNGYI